MAHFKIGTKVCVDGQQGEINYVQYSKDHPKYPHSYKITDLSATGKYKSQIRLEGGRYISHNRIKADIPGEALCNPLEGRELLLNLVANEVLTLGSLSIMVAKWMTDDDVQEMLEANELTARFDELEEEA